MGRHKLFLKIVNVPRHEHILNLVFWGKHMFLELFPAFFIEKVTLLKLTVLPKINGRICGAIFKMSFRYMLI